MEVVPACTTWQHMPGCGLPLHTVKCEIWLAFVESLGFATVLLFFLRSKNLIVLAPLMNMAHAAQK